MRRQAICLSANDVETTSGRALFDGLKLCGWEVKLLDPRFHHDSLINYIQDNSVELIVIGKGCSSNLDWADDLDITIVFWYPDVRESKRDYENEGVIDKASNADYCLIKTPVHKGVFRPVCSGVFYFRQAPSPLVVYPHDEWGKDEFDVGFIGDLGHQLHIDRIPYVQAISDTYSNTLFRGCLGEGKCQPFDAIRLHGLTKVNIGISALLPQLEGYHSVRDYNIMGSGNFLLTKRSHNMEKYFPVGEVCDTFETKHEMMWKIDYWLHHDEERKVIERNARQWFLRNASSYQDTKRWLNLIGLNQHGHSCGINAEIG